MITCGDIAKHCFLSAAETAAGGESLIEKHYLSLRRPHQVLCVLGNMCAWLGLDSNAQTLVNFGKYLEFFLTFATHPNQIPCFLRQMTLEPSSEIP